MTNAGLLDEARRCAPGDEATELAVMVHRLADALEATAAGAAPQEQRERVEKRLREVVYLCGDDLACDCEEARDGAEALARELSIIAAGEPALTEAKVWALAQALHDEAGDTDNVPAFVGSLADALRTAGIPFDEEPFVELGYLLPSSDPATVQVDEAKLEEVSGRESGLTTAAVRECFAWPVHELTGEESVAAETEFDRWLSEVERAAAEKAWEQGREVGYNDAREYHLYDGGCGPDPWDCGCDNPYRRDEGEKA